MATRVKVFVLAFIKLYIIKTLRWISFIFGMMVVTGLKFYSAPSLGPELEDKVTDLEFSYKSQFLQVNIAILSRPFNEFHIYMA